MTGVVLGTDRLLNVGMMVVVVGAVGVVVKTFFCGSGIVSSRKNVATATGRAVDVVVVVVGMVTKFLYS